MSTQINNPKFLFIFLCIFLQVSIYDCIDINKESNDRTEIQRMFIEYGAEIEQDICERVDEQTSRIFGDALCKAFAAKRFYGREVKFDYVLCKKVRVYRGLNLESNVVACIELSGKSIIIANGPKKSFYYVLDYQYPSFSNERITLNGQRVVHLLLQYRNFNINREDAFRKIQVHQTDEIMEADHIYRVYGTLKLKNINKKKLIGKVKVTQNQTNERHICAKKVGKLINGDICQKILQKLNSKYLGKYNAVTDDSKNVCVQIKIAGWREFEENAKTADELMMQCWFNTNENSDLQYVGVVNVNTGDDKYFFIARRHFDDYYRIDKCLRLP